MLIRTQGTPTNITGMPLTPLTGDPVGPPAWTGADRWPTLAQVLDELHEWWHETGQFLRLGS